MVKEWKVGKTGQEHGPDIKVKLDSTGQHILSWENPITILPEDDGKFVRLSAGQVNLYFFPMFTDDPKAPPRKLVGGELKVLQRLVAALIAEPCDITGLHDLVGASPVHALLVANNDAALDTVMAMFRAKPNLMYQTHVTARFGDPVFNGENCLIIAAVNRREKQVCEMIEIARQHLQAEERVQLYTEQPTGDFFTNKPMSRYGGTPVSYMACFGMKKALALLLYYESASVEHGGIGIDLNSSKQLKCRSSGMLPIHAVTANGLKDMFDYLVNLTDDDVDATGELPFKLADLDFKLRARRDKRNEKPGLLVSDGAQFADLTPLQMTVLLGSQRMFRHVIKEHTFTEWVWGAASKHLIYLDEIDSAGEGGNDVMELIGRLDAKEETKKMLLDDFMAGFLYELYTQKWDKFGFKMHVAQLALFAAYLVLLLVIAFAGVDGHELPEHVANGELVVDGVTIDPLSLLTSLDDDASAEDAEELLARWKATSWARTDRGVLAAMFVTMAMMIEEELREAFLYFQNRASLRDGGDAENLSKSMFREYLREINARSFFIKLGSWLSAAASGLVILGLERGDEQYTAEQQRRSKVVPLLLAPAIFLGVLYEMYELFSTSKLLGSLSIMFTKMFKENVSTWLAFFLFFLMQFWFAIILVLPINPIDEEADQTPSSLLFNLLVLAFTGDNFDLDFGLSGDTTSRDWRVGDRGDYLIGVALPRAFLIFFYVVFMIVSVIILLNLLIAMMSSTYDEIYKIAEMESRHMKARRVLRMELLTKALMRCLRIDQRVGNKDKGKDGSDRFYYDVITVENNVEGQVVDGGSNIFNDPSEAAADAQPPWARRLAEEVTRNAAAAASAAAAAMTSSDGLGVASGAGRPSARPVGLDGNDAAPPPYAAALASDALGNIDFSGSIDPFLAATTMRGGGPISLAPRLPPLETRDPVAGMLTPQGRGGPHPNFGAARSHRPPPSLAAATTTTRGGT